MEENNFKVVSSTSNFNDMDSKRKSAGFGKTVLIPFISGIAGCSLALGVFFYAPGVKDKFLLEKTPVQTVQTSTPSFGEETVSHISLTSYSDTAVFAANKILPSIVGIEIEYTVTSNYSFFGSSPASQTAKASGSGIIISKDGYILTNNHVVDSSSGNSAYSYYSISEAKSVKVKLYDDEKLYDAKIVGKDSQTDLAVLKIDDVDNLTAAEFADSSAVKVGEFTMAVGNPLGLESSITCGVVSAVNREVSSDDGTTYSCIQTDAAINSGNSGGALVNSEGKVIGVNTLKLSGTGVEGIGFAIPINSTTTIVSDLITHNKVLRPYIGITTIDLTDAQAKANDLPLGIYIKAIDDFSSAEKAGLKVGDVIVKVEGNEVSSTDELNKVKNSHKIGDTMKVTVNRKGEEKEISIVLQEAP